MMLNLIAAWTEEYEFMAISACEKSEKWFNAKTSEPWNGLEFSCYPSSHLVIIITRLALDW
jgi:hypothetical protein